MAGRDLIRDATEGYDELTGLKALADLLADELDVCADVRLVPQLARQYRETLGRIAEIEGGVDEDDEIAAIILRNRKPGADQHSRS